MTSTKQESPRMRQRWRPSGASYLYRNVDARFWFLIPALCHPADPVYIVHDTPAPMEKLAHGRRGSGFHVQLQEQPDVQRDGTDLLNAISWTSR